MLIRVLLAAIFAGALAGVFATAAQSVRVIPLILEAETYENGGGAHSHEITEGEAAAAAGESVAEAEAWGPATGFERTVYTGLANIFVGVAFALLLTAAILITNQAISVQAGLVWGLCGFVVFVLAPNFGLPPELPGMVAADLVERQVWWLATVILTAAGLALFAFKRGWVFMLAGLVLILAPHLYGAPRPETHASAVPANLAAEFVVATIVASGLFWLFLGGVLGFLLDRAMHREETA